VVTVTGLVVGMNIDGGGLDLFGMYGLAAIINVTGLLSLPASPCASAACRRPR